ncbi:hypothetical protein GCM10022243_24960 [Saccharothrix violaceirubra]|uniref:GNAT superfamily N-acetyltransferase n=1 Tax=Saccharothrix violaceirubra TaxID=413306 RepID=A0A7W7WY16_9PSEU|nr:GNAT family N-acetyltransferase [Saccharothrix violaceirubra]MBB4967940.1 GNAT superfamily N-acetyltransferase [Saccharothrix violaceirubra]
MEIDLIRPDEPDEHLRAGVHEVLHDVVAAGGAIGYPNPPDRTATDAWLDSVFDDVTRGRGGLVLARVDGVISGTAAWHGEGMGVFAGCAELRRVTAHPRARGLGLGALLVADVIATTRAAGLELLTLGVRGNNRNAIGLYESLGFREWGRLPNSVAVGDTRFDSVRMYLPLGYPEGTVLHGSAEGGNGSSPRRRASTGGLRARGTRS